jgi:hypothetical protein
MIRANRMIFFGLLLLGLCAPAGAAVRVAVCEESYKSL